MGLRKKYMKKSECDLNPEVMKENVSKNNLAVGSVTER